MEQNEDEPEDVRNATPVQDEIERGQKDEIIMKYEGETQKQPHLSREDETKPKKWKKKKRFEEPRMIKVLINEKECKLPKKEIIPRHKITKKEYLHLLSTPSPKCPPPCLKKTVTRKTLPIPPRINELAQPQKRRILTTLQERSGILPIDLLDNLINLLEQETCLTPEQAETMFKKRKCQTKKHQHGKIKSKYKSKSVTKRSKKPILDSEAVNCQYLMAEHFVRSIFDWKCPFPKEDIHDIAKVILRRLSKQLDYVPVENGDRTSQQMRLLADIVACWISGVIMEVAEDQKEKLEEEYERQKKLLEEAEEEEEQFKKEEKETELHTDDDESGEDDDEEDEEEPEGDIEVPKTEEDDETERKRKEDEEAERKRMEEEEEAKRKRLEEEEAEKKRLEEEEIERKRLEEEEAEKKRLEEEELRRQEEEKLRKEEEEEKLRLEEEEKVRERMSDEIDIKSMHDEEEEAARLAKEKEEEILRQEEEEKKLREEEERKRKEEEEQKRKQEEEEEKEKKRKAEEEERKRKEEEEEQRRQQEEEQKRKIEEEEQKRKIEEEEHKRKEEEEAEEPKRVEEDQLMHEGKRTRDKMETDDFGDLFQTDLPFMTFSKVLKAFYTMLKDYDENTGNDPVTNRIHRALFEKLEEVIKLENSGNITNNIKDYIDVITGKLAVWLKNVLSESEIMFMSKYPPEIESQEVRDWGSWLIDVTKILELNMDWRQTKYKEFDEMKKKKVTRKEWVEWTKDFHKNALMYRRLFLEILHQAHHHAAMKVDRKVVPTGAVKSPDYYEKELRTMDLVS